MLVVTHKMPGMDLSEAFGVFEVDVTFDSVDVNESFGDDEADLMNSRDRC